MSSIVQYAPAKLNLFLHITGKRPDGYHNLQTVFRLINLYDTLTFDITNKPNLGQLPIQLKNAETITEAVGDNLIVKASLAMLNFVKNQSLFSQSQIDNLPIVNIRLDKQIPMGAGLGGGSSDCATTLMMLNDIWQLNLSNQQIRDIGATLGADVPIFIFGQDAIAEGIGEILTPIDLLPQRFLLLKPNAHINTKVLFGNSELHRNCPIFSHTYLRQHTADFTDNLSIEFSNVFEPVVKTLSNEITNALDYLSELAKSTGTTPRLTGSGSCVFLPLPTSLGAKQLNQWQQQAPCQSWVVNSLGS